MAAVQQQTTKVLETLAVKSTKPEDLAKKLGRPLGSPINQKEVGAQFPVTLTGKIEIREFAGTKGAYYLTKEGVSIKVNASFDPATHKEGAVMTAQCVLLAKDESAGIMRDIKYAVLVD